ncbi:phage tail protein [Pseudoalteromonas nigrifaciens]|uniref:phage tail-collar fiber domain-containing protein n=1 Tax=Pseudoalteromonas nigrifaciens TaxID=28109 RepID=UPI003D057877
MAQVITLAGEKLFATKAQANQQLDIDTFIFANVAGQDPAAAIDRNEGIPTNAIVHQQNVQQTGRINDNVVVYSTVLDSVTGPFEFNWVGLYSSVNQTLVAISHVPTVSKTITAPGSAGNTLNRNFGIEYSGIADLAGISVSPETWQLDFSARLSGMDELTRQLASDMNGKDWFIDSGFKVVPRSTANTFSVTPGVGYVSGLRVELKQEHILTLQTYPQFVYVDAYFDGNASSQWKPQVAFTVTSSEMDDYIDVNGVQHYVVKLAEINTTSSVEDLRNTNGISSKINKNINEVEIINNDLSISEKLKSFFNFSQSKGYSQPVYIVGDSITEGSNSNDWRVDNFASIIRNAINMSFDNRNFGFANFNFRIFEQVNESEFAHKCVRNGFDGHSFQPAYFGGVMVESNIKGEYIDVEYTGKDFCVVYGQSENDAIINVYVDSILFGTINTKSEGIKTIKGSSYNGRFSGHIKVDAWGQHKVRLEVSGNSNVKLCGLVYYEDFVLKKESPTVFNVGRSSLTLTEIPDEMLLSYAQSGMVILSLGVNDDLLETSINVFKDKLELLFDKIAFYHGSVVVNDFIFSKGSENTYKKALRDICNKHSVRLLDFSKIWFGNELENKASGLLDSDGIHPTNAGHECIARVISNEIKLPFWGKATTGKLILAESGMQKINSWEEWSAVKIKNTIYCQGMMQNRSGGTLTAGSRLGEMPAGYNKSLNLAFPVASDAGANTIIEIRNDGGIYILKGEIPNDKWVSMSGIYFSL